MNGRDLIKWKPPVIDAHVHDDGGKTSTAAIKRVRASRLLVLVSIIGSLSAIAVFAGAQQFLFTEEASLFFDEEPGTAGNDEYKTFGFLIPGQTKGTSLYAEWDRDEECFFLEIRDERPGSVWHVDTVDELDGEPPAPAVETVFETDECIWYKPSSGNPEGVLVLRFSKQRNSIFLHEDINGDFLHFFTGEYLDVFIRATHEHLRFKTDQRVVTDALKKYFMPAVRVKEKLEAEKKAEERRKVSEKEKVWQENRKERITEAFVGKWKTEGLTRDYVLDIYKDGTANIKEESYGFLFARNLTWTLNFETNELFVITDSPRKKHVLNVVGLSNVRLEDLPELNQICIKGNIYRYYEFTKE